jgi:threonyl-tRNA synthetase
MPRLALKVDCDTFEGTKKGLPNLLRLFDKFQIRASFFFTLGPDTSGRAIMRVFTRKGFLKKMLRSNAAALYGPKIDFMATDSLGREWQVATIQLDLNLPDRFDLTCINEKGEKERIVMIHAAIMGSLERFLSIFIEHHAGLFPLWIAPVQVGIIPVADTHEAYARDIEAQLSAQGIRTQFYDHSDSLGKRIREGETQKIPYLLVMGDKEIESSSVTVRNVKTKKQVTVSVKEFMQTLLKEVGERKLEASIG